MSDVHFKIIVPVFNSADYVSICLNSINMQNYKNYEVHVVVDPSDDGTAEIVEKMCTDYGFGFTINRDRLYAVNNIVNSIAKIGPSDDDVIVMLDGDDWFANDDVLNYLNGRVYNSDNVLMSYGSHEQTDGNKIISRRYKRHEYRKTKEWHATHLKTFRFRLFKNIKDEDFKMPNGRYFPVIYDRVLMYPMLEMAGPNRIKVVEDILYIYNVHNKVSVLKTFDSRKKRRLRNELESRRPYGLLK